CVRLSNFWTGYYMGGFDFW
nr:immunoglobulin heavy chain junction region [Macaca mulatta]